jgi:hypothetical protein
MEAYWGSGGIAPRILDLVWSVSLSGRFTPRERAPGTWLAEYVSKYKLTIMSNIFIQSEMPFYLKI